MPMCAAACYWTFLKRGAEWSIIHDAGEEARAASEGVHGSTTTPETESHCLAGRSRAFSVLIRAVSILIFFSRVSAQPMVGTGMTFGVYFSLFR